eukprot:CAMPEP_0115175080 /NCGR_PEP_ID=MMETSP0270-20121206/4173_1 /TAXON_ID=71861 /ORGANISM="Scrippsiella trochoidea, Strain CCMP3099" /LENGTH=507 /DNA_ID=CAMNT_0002587945 /DNA_START=1 /DNA_END=1524 /DNA_ORIENTATION=-
MPAPQQRVAEYIHVDDAESGEPSTATGSREVVGRPWILSWRMSASGPVVLGLLIAGALIAAALEVGRSVRARQARMAAEGLRQQKSEVPPSPASMGASANGARTEWRVVRGDAHNYPQLQLRLGSSEFAPFQLRGFDYSPISKCCGNNDASTFQKRLYTRDIPRMAAMGVNAIKLYGMCDGVLDKSNLCPPPEPGCERQPVTVADVRAFLDLCYSHRIFVLLASRAGPGDLEAYSHIVATYGAHSAVAGVILFDETLDLSNFNAAAKILHEGFCKVLGKDPSTTPVEEAGRIITTAAQMQIPQSDFQSKYGQYVNGWGFDPYSEWQYTENFLPDVPFKPYFIMENGINGAFNAGCRDDCPPCPTCDLQACKCIPCSCLAKPWREYVEWMSTARIAGLFIFEWTDENWKGGVKIVGGNTANVGGVPGETNAFCLQTKTKDDGPGFNEANHGLFAVAEDGQLVPKSMGGGETLASVLRQSWTNEEPGLGGFRGWQSVAKLPIAAATKPL